MRQAPSQAGGLNLLARSCALVACCLSIGTALAADTTSAQAALKRELAVCNSGASNQDRKVCLREAHAAYAQSRRGALNDSADYQRNARLRCEALKGDEREACDARMKGAGQVSGSVANGGVLRELTVRSVGPTTVTPAPAPATPPTPSPKP